MKNLFLVLMFVFAALPAAAQQAGCVNATPCVQTNSFVPSGSTSLAVSAASSRVALPTAGSNLTAVVTNSGAAVSYIVLGGSTVTATASNIPVQPGQTVALLQAANTYVAGITASGTSSLLIQSGTGVPVVSTISGTVIASATLAAPLPAGTNAIGSITNTAFGISGTLPAFAATPTVNVGTLPTLPTGTNTIGNIGNIATVTAITNALPAGTNVIGSTAGLAASVPFTQTVTAASAYAAGNAVGGLITLATINRASGLSVYAQSVTVASKSLQAGQMDLVFFNANPTGSTCTDKTAFSIAAADAAKVVGSAHVSDWTASALGSVGQMQQPPIGIAVPVTTLYACLVTRSTPTFTATTDIAGIVFVVQN